ncbi:MAG: hypothetical protein HYS06_04465 [Methylocystis sp.]|nr:hypothetical protein [Methylocystis sp.]
MTAKVLTEVLQRVETWPQEDQEALAEYAREIEARRTGLYRLTDDERAAIKKARESKLIPDEEMGAYWKRHGVT